MVRVFARTMAPVVLDAQNGALPGNPASAPAKNGAAKRAALQRVVREVIAQHVVPRRAKLVVTFRGRNLVIPPVKAGYTAAVDYAVKVAMLYGRSHALPATGTVDVPLRERNGREQYEQKYKKSHRQWQILNRLAAAAVAEPRLLSFTV